MPVFLRWTKPRPVAEWEWHQAYRQFRHAVRNCLLWGLLLGVLAVCLVYRASPQHVGRAVEIVIGGLAVAVMLALVLTLASYKSYEKYEVCTGGLVVDHPRGKLYRWRDIYAWWLSDHPELPEIRCLEFSLTQTRRHRCWCFDPWQVDETELRAVLEEHLQGSFQDRQAEL